MCCNPSLSQVIRMELTEAEAAAEGKHMEAMVGQRLSHPHIVKSLASGSMRIKVHLSIANPLQRDDLTGGGGGGERGRGK